MIRCLHNSENLICEFSLPELVVAAWASEVETLEPEIMKLDSFQFDRFPDGTANRLHKYNLFAKDNLSDLSAQTGQVLGLVLQKVNPQLEVDSLWMTSWVNVLYQDQELGLHSHDDDPSRLYSGVIHLSNQKTATVFELGSTKRILRVVPRKGCGILFPSSLRHRVERHTGSAKRISLVFDIASKQPSELWIPLPSLRVTEQKSLLSACSFLVSKFLSKRLLSTQLALVQEGHQGK